MKKYVVFFAFLFQVSQASATFVDRNKLHLMLQAQNRVDAGGLEIADHLKTAHLLGYVKGLADAADGRSLCITNGAQGGQLVAIVAKYIDGNPGLWASSANVLIVNALTPVFLCKK